MPSESNRRTVVVTGVTSDLGTLLLPVLLADAQVQRVIALDLAKPGVADPKLDYQRLDLLDSGAEANLRDVLQREGADTLVHLAFLNGRIRNEAVAHELEVIGTLHLLAAASRSQLKRLILPSLTALYGAKPSHPAVLGEDAPLLGCPGSRFLHDKIQVEEQLEAFRKRHSQTQVIVLRFAPIVGARSNNPFTRWLKARWVPTLLGFDPLWQLVHEEDAVLALHRALYTDASGPFNVVGRGVVSLSELVYQAGAQPIPLPRPWAQWAIRAMAATGLAAVPEPLLDYLHYSWVADGRRAAEKLGFVARHHAAEAAASLRGN